MSWHAGSRPAARRDIEPTVVDQELVLWDPRLRRVHRLDPVGSLLWPLLDGTATVAELAGDVAAVWRITETEANDALLRLIDQLDTQRLLAGTALDEASEAAEPGGTIVNPQRCGTDLSAWTWEEPTTVEVGGARIAFRVNDPELRRALRLALAAHLVDDDIPVNYSLAAPDRGGALSLLFWGRCTVARGRTAADGVAALLAHLAGHGRVAPGAVRIDGHLLTAGDRGVVFPATERSLLWRVAARLRRTAGASVVAAPWVDVDAHDGRVVSPRTELRLDRDALAAIAGRPDPVPVECRAVAMWVPGWIAIDSPASLASGLIEQDLLVDPSSALPQIAELSSTLELLHRPDGARPAEVAGLVARCLDVPLER